MLLEHILTAYMNRNMCSLRFSDTVNSISASVAETDAIVATTSGWLHVFRNTYSGSAVLLQ